MQFEEHKEHRRKAEQQQQRENRERVRNDQNAIPLGRPEQPLQVRALAVAQRQRKPRCHAGEARAAAVPATEARAVVVFSGTVEVGAREGAPRAQVPKAPVLPPQERCEGAQDAGGGEETVQGVDVVGAGLRVLHREANLPRRRVAGSYVSKEVIEEKGHKVRRVLG